jgi:hypothetical protein
MRDPIVMSLFVSAILVGSATSAQQLPEAKWVETSAGCKFLDRFPAPNTVYTWSGSCVDGYVSGEGTLQMSGVMQWQFKGTFKEGRLLNGTVTFPNGEYTGALKDNLAEGQGVYRYSSGVVVEGTFVAGRVNGEATMSYTDGSKYVGPLSRRNEPQGKGRKTYANGGIYEGEFVDGVEQGQGTMTSPDGGSYKGAFLAGDFNGEGEMHYADGGTYVGGFRAGKRQGHGTLHSADGTEYVGDFVANLRHGMGRYVQANGDVFEGEWKNDTLNGKCQVNATVLQYSGSCVSGKFHGNGRLTMPDYFYEGAFVAGAKHGRGTERIANEEEYEGEFVQGQREGKGKLRVTSSEGKVSYEGLFKAGLMHGDGVLTTEQATLQGEFRDGLLYRGTMTGKSGRKFEIDNERQTVFEILPDGSKRPAANADLKDLTV